MVLSSNEANLRPAIVKDISFGACMAATSSSKLTEAASWTSPKGLRRTGSSVEIHLPVFVPDEPALGFEDANVRDFPHAVLVLAFLACLASLALVDVQGRFHVAGPISHL